MPTSLRRAKTDKKDVIKLANYGIDHWLALSRYIPEDEVQLMLKTTYRQYQQCTKVQTMLKNNLVSLLDTAFPDANRLFTGGWQREVGGFCSCFPSLQVCLRAV